MPCSRSALPFFFWRASMIMPTSSVCSERSLKLTNRRRFFDPGSFACFIGILLNILHKLLGAGADGRALIAFTVLRAEIWIALAFGRALPAHIDEDAPATGIIDA